jgi:hypothetical protein
MSTPAPASHRGEPGAADGGFAPALIVDVELTGPLPPVRYDGRHRRVWVLARLHGEPVGSCLLPLDASGLAPGQRCSGRSCGRR